MAAQQRWIADLQTLSQRRYNGRVTELPIVDVAGVGLNATDTLISLPAYPARGSKVEYSEASVMPGGQTATAVIACQAWGLRTRYVGKLGDDDAARLHRETFVRAGVEAHLIPVSDAASPQSLILVDGGGERTVFCRRDERLVLQPGDLNRAWIERSRALLVDGHDTAAAIEAAGWARAAGVPVIADLDELYPGVDDLIAKVDYLIVSRDFPGRLMRNGHLESALRSIPERYGCRLVGATLGEDGVLAWDGERMLHRRAYRVPVADSTGAGDIFHAGFIYALLQGWSLQRQLDFSCAAAALNCTAAGARGRIASVADIENLMATGSHYEATFVCG